MPQKELSVNSKIINIIMPTVILLAGFVMMIVGIWRGELEMIFRKAVVVCLECIGIG